MSCLQQHKRNKFIGRKEVCVDRCIEDLTYIRDGLRAV